MHGDSDEGPAMLGGALALQLLADYGLNIAPMTVCDSTSVGPAAAALGYPVVVKSADENIAHRTELGLVAVNLSNGEQVEAAVARMAAKSEVAEPMWLVQKMVTGGVELILTVRNADDLGVFGTVGIGGAAVELHRDVEHVPLPCDAETLHKALSRLRLAELLFGFRGSEPVDQTWIAKTLNRMAVLLAEQNLAEIEVNPAIVADSAGAIVDALCVPSRSAGS
jgi:succinyl-CoA synthetase beta subunit